MTVISRVIARYPLASFFLLTFAWSWLVWVPLALAQAGRPITNIPVVLGLVLLGAFGPNIVAVALTALLHGKRGVRLLLRRFRIWRVPVSWYGVMVLLPPVLWVITSLVYGLVNGVTPVLSGPWYLFIVALLGAIVTGPIAEEIGWRGYALPRLQQRLTALQSGMVLGVMWGVWHAPVFWVPGIALAIAETGQPLAMTRYVLTAIPISVLFVWLYNNTRGSLLFALLFHASLNASGGFIISTVWPSLTPTAIPALTWFYVGIVWLCMALVTWFWGASDLAATPRGVAPLEEPVQSSPSAPAPPLQQAT